MNEREVKAEVWLPLSQGKVAVIDFEDWDNIRPYSWRFAKHSRKGGTGYARGVVTENGKQVHRRLHHVVFGKAPPGLEVGHKDGDGLNCRQNNLWFVTPTQNGQGKKAKWAGATSRYRGVSLKKYTWLGSDKITLRWQAAIRANKKQLHLGYYSTEIEAAHAYDLAARKYFGEYAAPNFPEEKQNG